MKENQDIEIALLKQQTKTIMEQFNIYKTKMKNGQTTLLQDIKDNWMLVLFVGSLIVGWTTLSNRLTHVEAQEQETKTALQSIQQIEIDIATIKKDVEYIKLQWQK